MAKQTSAGLQTHAKFAYTDSDLILRSSDDVLFRVHKTKLAAHSTVFQDMFECGTASADDRTADTRVSEPAATLAVLLSLCYPASDDQAMDDFRAIPLELLIDVYEATYKYDMWVARELLAHRVAPRMSEDPFRLVWTGYILRNEPLLAAASLSTLGRDILGDASYRVKSGLAWTSLVEYHVAYKRLVTSTLHSMSCMLCNDLDPNRLTDKYRCKPRGGYGDMYCDTAKLYQGQWRDLRGRLSVQISAEWPEAALQSFVDGCLNTASVLSCPGCANTWREMRKETTKLRPSLTLRLEDVDRVISVLRSSPESLVHKRQPEL